LILIFATSTSRIFILAIKSSIKAQQESKYTIYSKIEIVNYVLLLIIILFIVVTLKIISNQSKNQDKYVFRS